jgi:hypothetical protein
VRTIEVHGACEHGAVPRTNASSAETNVTEEAAKPPGTGPPAGCVAVGVVVAVVVVAVGVVAVGVVAVGVVVAAAVVAVGVLAVLAEAVGVPDDVGVAAPPPPEPEPGEPQPDSAKVVNSAQDRRATPSRGARKFGSIPDPLFTVGRRERSGPVTGLRCFVTALQTPMRYRWLGIFVVPKMGDIYGSYSHHKYPPSSKTCSPGREAAVPRVRRRPAG